jgi:hypothetical protein
MTSLINFSVNNTRLSVAPGASVELAVTVQNLTTLLDQVAVRLIGIDPAWVQVIPQQLPIFAQTQATARVIIGPPNDLAKSPAGIYPVQVSGASAENQGQEGETKTELEIQLVGDYQLRVEGSGTSGGQEAIYPITVKNVANASLQIRFSGSDHGDALWYKFEPFQLIVPPGTDAEAKLTVRARPGSTKNNNVIFSLTAQGEYLLKGGGQTTAPVHQLSGQFTRAAPSALTLSLRAVSTGDNSAIVFEVRVGNPNPAPVTARLAGQGKTGSLNLEFAPPELTLAAQSYGRSMLVVRPTSALTSEVPHSETFQVSALIIEGEAQPASAEATFTPVVVTRVQKPMPLLLILLIVLLAFFVTAILLLILAIGLGLLR